MPPRTSEHPRHAPVQAGKARQRWIIAALLGVVMLGGVAGLMRSGGQPAAAREEYQIVDITAPPPPPPPPPADEPTVEEEIEESIEPMEMSPTSEPTNTDVSEVDLGIDIGDLAASSGSGFAIEIPRFGRAGGKDDDGGGMMDGILDSPPTPLTKAQPTYPGSLLKKGIGGRVLVSCVVDDAGRVAATSIKSSSGHPDLDRAALNAVGKWKFKPGVKAGKSVKATCVVPFSFEVKKS